MPQSVKPTGRRPAHPYRAWTVRPIVARALVLDEETKVRFNYQTR